MSTRYASNGLLDPRSKLAVFIAACFSAFSGLTHPQEFALLGLCIAVNLLCQKWKRAFFICLILLKSENISAHLPKCIYQMR